MSDVIEFKLTFGTDTQKTAAVRLPNSFSYVAIFIPDLNVDANIGLEVYPSAGPNKVASASLAASSDTGWHPVLDNSDGQDAVICASTYDPGVVDITPFIAGFPGQWIRCTASVAQGTTTTWIMFVQ